MRRYFKLVAINDGQKDWMYQEFFSGKVRFGWSAPGSNLNIIKNKNREELSEEERIVWRYSNFLLNRINKGDILIIQLERPLREFLIAEVTEGYTYDEEEKKDFNHIILSKPLSTKFIPLDSVYISNSMRHDLTKRGQYYEIYPKETISEIDKLISEKLWNKKDFYNKHSIDLEFTKTNELLLEKTIDVIMKKWKGKDFESFVEEIIKKTPGLEVKRKADIGKGWDLTLRIEDPLTGEILFDNVPVQCKNYTGIVTDERPIQDLERCVQNSDSDIAYLFIMGELNDQYLNKIRKKQDELIKKTGRNITFRIVQQDRIAELYLKLIRELI